MNDHSVLFDLISSVLTYLYCLQHQDLKEIAVASFSAKVDSHDCHMYIFTPNTAGHVEI